MKFWIVGELKKTNVMLYLEIMQVICARLISYFIFLHFFTFYFFYIFNLKAFEGEYSHADCGAHKLNLCVEKLFSNNICEILAKCRSIVGHFSHSNLAYDRLEEAQLLENLPRHKLIQVLFYY